MSLETNDFSFHEMLICITVICLAYLLSRPTTVIVHNTTVYNPKHNDPASLTALLTLLQKSKLKTQEEEDNSEGEDSEGAEEGKIKSAKPITLLGMPGKQPKM